MTFAQELLTHSTVDITLEIYSHVTEGFGRDAADRVASLTTDCSIAPKSAKRQRPVEWWGIVM